MKTKLNAWDRFNRDIERQEKESDNDIGELPNRPQRQELSISPGTMVLGRILFGRFK